ncbi:MAG: protein kinase domain-containing protein [Rhizobacter sp.]
MSALRPGQLMKCVDSQLACRVDDLIGEGGQGEVYRVTLDARPYALKWYHPIALRVDRGLRQRLLVALERGAPTSEFLWPFELVTLPDGSGLGYLMRLRTESHLKIQSVLAEEVRPSFRVLATVCCRLTEALLALHGKGLVYQDLNAGNLFFDRHTGQIEICDNDNVDIDGAPSVMGGVWEFQAPEVVLRQSGPSRATDLHSLAVMLFRILHIGHPLVGRCELDHHNLTDQTVLRRLYGSGARFVFDPSDASNRPLPERHGPVLGHWAIYPQALRDLFTRAFTDGLFDPLHGRVQESEWRKVLRQLHDSVLTCGACGAQNFHDPQRLAAKQRHFACWGCGAALSTSPPRIGLRRPSARSQDAPLHVVVLDAGARLQSHHLDEPTAGHPTTEAQIVVEPTLGLVNLSRQTWAVRPEAGTDFTSVAHGERLALSHGQRIDFGRMIGEIKL